MNSLNSITMTTKQATSNVNPYYELANTVFLFSFNSSEYNSGTKTITATIGSYSAIISDSGGYFSISTSTFKTGTGSYYSSASVSSTSTERTYISQTIPVNNYGYTFCFWINMMSFPTQCMLFSLQNTTTNPRTFVFFNGTYIQVAGNGNDNKSVYNKSSITLGQWFHFAATIAKNGALNAYVNGSSVYTGTVTYTSATFSYNGIMCDPYNNWSGAGASPYGYMDNLLYVDGVLSQTQIQTLYNYDMNNP